MPATDPLDEINRIGRQTALPAVSPTATPAVNQTNLNVASSMERADIGNRFGFGSPQYQQGTETSRTFAPDTTDIMNSAIDNRMAAIASGQDPDAPARYVGPKRSAELQREFLTLGESRRRNAVTDAHAAHQQFVEQQHIRSASDYADFAIGLADITSKYQQGTPQFEQAILQHVSNHPEGAMTAAGQKLLTRIAGNHDQIAVTADRIKAAQENFKAATGKYPDSVEVTATGGINLRNTKDTEKQSAVLSVAEKALANIAVTPEEFATRQNLRRGKTTPSGKFTNDYSGADKGDEVAFDVGGDTFHMPLAQYQNLDRAIPPAAKQTQSTGTTGPAKKVLKWNPTTGKLE